MNHVLKCAEWAVFILYCAIPLSLVVGVIFQNGQLFMNTAFGFCFAYLAYGMLMEAQNEEA